MYSKTGIEKAYKRGRKASCVQVMLSLLTPDTVTHYVPKLLQFNTNIRTPFLVLK